MGPEIAELKEMIKNIDILIEKEALERAERSKMESARSKEQAEILKEQAKRSKEQSERFKELDKLFEKTGKMFDETRKMFKETDAKFKETDKQIKNAFDLFEGQWGKLMESLVAGDLVRLLRERGIQITDTSTRRKGKKQGENYEFDIIAHNGTEIVIVEVKTTLRVKYVKKFLEQLKKVKEWLPEYKNFSIYGAIAFLDEQEDSALYAQKQELFVIKATGDSASIVNDANFKPKAF